MLPLRDVVLDDRGSRFILPPADEELISSTFLSNIKNYVKFTRLSSCDKIVLIIGVLALAALISLVSTQNFFAQPALSYSLVALVALVGIYTFKKIIPWQYNLYMGMRSLYIDFAGLAAEPYLTQNHLSEKLGFHRTGSRTYAYFTALPKYFKLGDKTENSYINIKAGELFDLGMTLRKDLSVHAAFTKRDLYKALDNEMNRQLYLKLTEQFKVETTVKSD